MIGKQIKGLAMIICVFNIIIFFLLGIGLKVLLGSSLVMIVIFALGALFSWIFYLFFGGYGQLIEDTYLTRCILEKEFGKSGINSEEAQTAKPAETKTLPSGEWICRNCGTLNSTTAKRCRNCTWAK